MKKFTWKLSIAISAIACIISYLFLNIPVTNVLFFLSVVMSIDGYFALTPTKRFGPHNPMKGGYEKKGNLKGYEKFCATITIIVFSFGIISIVLELLFL